MTELSWPVTIKNGDIVLVKNDTEKINTRIYHYIHTVRGEAIWDAKLGLPFYLFQAREDIQRDFNLITISLTSQMPEISFNVSGSLDENGVVYMLIKWDYQELGDELEMGFEI